MTQPTSASSLNAAVSIPAHRRDRSEHLCRYITRPALCLERSSQRTDGRVQWQPKRSCRDDTTHFVFTPEDFIARLAALVPRPQHNLTRPAHRPADLGHSPCDGPLERVFNIDITLPLPNRHEEGCTIKPLGGIIPPVKAPNKSLTRLSFVEQLNFLVTNRIPRRTLTRFMGWYSKLRSRSLTRVSIWIWRRFADDLRLYESAQQDFTSLHDCFTRTLVADARPICSDPLSLVSPCDAVVGEFGAVAGLEVLQAKGFPYTLPELLQDAALAEHYRDGRYVTLRLKSSMYHHFHAPLKGELRDISYISGDTWNVNPIALKRVERLFCRNERAVIRLHTAERENMLTLVPVAAVLVASMRFHGLDQALNLQYSGPNTIEFRKSFAKGDPLGYFEHGSTIVMLAPAKFQFCDHIRVGEVIRMGQPLMERVTDLES